MFTGIVAGLYPVRTIDAKRGLATLTIELDPTLVGGVAPGASIAVNGVCLTVTGVSGSFVTFDAMEETLSVTNLGRLEEGDLVNIERAAQIGDEIGGHLVSGHVDAEAKIVEIESPENNRVITFALPREYMRFVFQKGFIAVDGASLTVARVDRGAARFSVFLIPETLRRTTLGRKVVGESVNIEIDRATQAVVETVAALLQEGLLEEGSGAPRTGRRLER